MKQGAFARAVGAQDGHHLTLGNGEGDSAQGLDRAVRCAQILDHQQILGFRTRPRGKIASLTEIAPPLVLDPEIGLDDRRIFLDLTRAGPPR